MTEEYTEEEFKIAKKEMDQLVYESLKDKDVKPNGRDTCFSEARQGRLT